MTFVGESNWSSIAINVSVRVDTSALRHSATPNVALSVFWSRSGLHPSLQLRPLNGTWVLGCAKNVNGTLPIKRDGSGWRRVSFGALSDGTLFGEVDGVRLFSNVQCGGRSSGFAALGTGTHRADFDDLVLWLPPPVPPPPPPPYVRYGAWVDDSLAGSLQFGRARNDFSGLAGVSFRLTRNVNVTALGRIAVKKADGASKPACAIVNGNSTHASSHGKHNLSLWRFTQPLPFPGGKSATLLASTVVDMAQGKQDGVGFVYAALPAPVSLNHENGAVEYALTSEEHKTGDVFCDGALLPPATVNESIAVLTGGVWGYNASALHPSAEPSSGTFDGRVYGPVSFTIKTDDMGASTARRGSGCTSNLNCSLNGLCEGGVCQCDAPWHGPACELIKFKPVGFPQGCKSVTRREGDVNPLSSVAGPCLSLLLVITHAHWL